MLNDNGPTHVDSFSHLDPDPTAPTIDQMPLDLFYGDAVCVDVSEVPIQTDIEPAQIEESLAKAKLEVRQGDMVFFYTATYDRHRGTPQYLSDFPGLGFEASHWILDHGVKTFGVDSPTPDNPISKTYPCHMMCRAHHITHYENLVLTEVVGKRFTFIGFPLKVVGAHGGPTRAVALVD
jgi:kynurenine formamidase